MIKKRSSSCCLARACRLQRDRDPVARACELIDPERHDRRDWRAASGAAACRRSTQNIKTRSNRHIRAIIGLVVLGVLSSRC